MATRKALFLCLGLVLLSQVAIAGQKTTFNYISLNDQDEQTLSVNFENEPLADALHLLARKVNVGISYDTKMMPRKLITYRAENKSIYKILRNILKDTGLYTTLSKNRKVILIKKEPVLPAIQQETITGTVTDAETGETLPGVNILVKGTSTGASTDPNGEYELTVESLQDTLVFSFIGYQRQEVPIQGRTDIDITLQSQAILGEELIVVGYGTQEKENLTASVSTVDSDVFQEESRANIAQSLQGNVSGLKVTKGNGQPGAPVNVNIRGLGSINASSSPLYVVDGIPVTTDTGVDYGNYGGFSTSNLAGLNPQDIASVTVLKDAAAASIYGSRAANGVILITTKEGKSGETNIDFSAQYGFNEMSVINGNYPLNTNEALELAREGWKNAGEDPNSFDSKLEEEGIDATQNTNWMDALTRMGSFQKYNLSVSGGSEKTQYYVSGGFHNSQAVMKYLNYKKGTGRISIKSKPFKKLSINADVTGHYQHTLNAQRRLSYAANPVQSMYQLQPWLSIYNPDGSYNFDYNITYNPIAIINETRHNGINSTINGNIGAQLQILEGLEFETKNAFNLIHGNTSMFFPADFGWGRNTNGRGYTRASQMKVWTTSNLLRYNQTFQSRHNLEAFIGFEAQNFLNTGTFNHATDFLPGLYTLNSASQLEDVSSSDQENSLTGVFLHADYNYNNNYFLSASVRRDGSSRFGAKKRYGTFWSISVGWSIYKTLLEGASFISNLKLRTSYGTNGNQEIGNFESQGRYDSGYNYNGEAGYVFSQYGNPLLTWEKNKPFNLGVDFGFFDGRLRGSIEYYVRNTTSLLLDAPLPATSGRTSYTVNRGSMKNSGWEISLNSRNFINGGTNGFSWSTDLNISTLKNIVTKLPNEIITDLYIHEEGLNYYTWYLPAYAGVDPQTGEKLWYSSKDKTQTTTSYEEAVRLKYGSSVPKLNGGLTNKFTYRNFNLSFLIDFSWDYKLYNTFGTSANSDGAFLFNSGDKLSRYTYKNRWQEPGDKTDVPKIVYNGSPSQRSSRWLADGSYIRLKNITLGYNLPTKIFSGDMIRSANIYLRATDLFTYVKDDRLMFNPVQNLDGQRAYHTPKYKTVVLGLNINL